MGVYKVTFLYNDGTKGVVHTTSIRHIDEIAAYIVGCEKVFYEEVEPTTVFCGASLPEEMVLDFAQQGLVCVKLEKGVYVVVAEGPYACLHYTEDRLSRVFFCGDELWNELIEAINEGYAVRVENCDLEEVRFFINTGFEDINECLAGTILDDGIILNAQVIEGKEISVNALVRRGAYSAASLYDEIATVLETMFLDTDDILTGMYNIPTNCMCKKDQTYTSIWI